ncbi:hypothetical protein MPC38_06680 [Prescottella equi]|uniref:hypothetical protein n=1 Tax=Rhodococcus hoagii TaxID=43767 RepID=UPI001F5B82C3|nr:hypothetical protein [Prescottella equi]UNQ40930.1 hypothetical protein MPC38_06680 [Prescottella equi]
MTRTDTLIVLVLFLALVLFGAFFSYGYFRLSDENEELRAIIEDLEEGQNKKPMLALPSPQHIKEREQAEQAQLGGEFKTWWNGARGESETSVVDVETVQEETPPPPPPPPQPATAKVRIFDFSSPHDIADTFEALITSMAGCKYYRDQEGEFVVEEHTDKPPLALCPYFSELNGGRIVLNLGNRTEKYWTLVITMTPGENGVTGTVGFDRRYSQIQKKRYNGAYTNLYALSIALNMPRLLQTDFGIKLSNQKEYMKT